MSKLTVHEFVPEADTSHVPQDKTTVVTLPHATSDAHPTLDRDRVLYGISGEIVKTLVPATEADPVALLITFLVCFGSAVGRGAWINVGAIKHFCNLFVALVGNSAKARKGTSLQILKSTIFNFAPDWSSQCIASGLSSGEGLIAAFQSENGNENDKRLLALETEFAQPLKALARDGNTLGPVLRLAWDGLDLRVMTRKSPLSVSEPHISLIGHITSSELQKVFVDDDVFNGLGNRILWFAVKRSQLLPFGADVNQNSLNSLNSQLRKAYVFARNAGEIGWSSEARTLWEEIYEELSLEGEGFIAALTARAEPQVLRLALLYALLDSSTIIEVKHLEVARELWRYADNSIHYIFSERAGSPLEEKISQFLKAVGGLGLTRTELSEALGRHERSRDIEAVLGKLENENRLERRLETTTGRSKQVLVWIKEYAKKAN